MPKATPYFAAFRWPMPESFAAAVAANRFELGDVLYRDAHAYDAWAGKPPEEAIAVQVLDPPRSARGTLLEGDVDRRRANWASPVRILVVDPGGAIPPEERILTQGRLLSAWWHGDEAWLDPNAPEPDFPRTGRELFGNLDSIQSTLVTRAARRRVRSGSAFALVVDLASDASRAKARAVLEQLRLGGEVKSFDLLPAETGLVEAGAYHPTLVVRTYLLPERDTESIGAGLRTVLYRGGGVAAAPPSSSTQTNSSEETTESAPSDRFSIGRHGLLFAL